MRKITTLSGNGATPVRLVGGKLRLPEREDETGTSTQMLGVGLKTHAYKGAGLKG